MKIENNKVVELEYELSVDGKVVDKTTEMTGPLDYIHGTHMLLPKFESEIEGMEPESEFAFTLTPEEGYGEYDSKRKFDIPKSSFEVDGAIREDLLVIGRVIPLLNSLAPKLLCVRGNCDAEVDQMVLNFPVLADYAVLPVGQRLVYVTHGHVFNLNHLPPLAPGDILLHGHTHVPAWTNFGQGNLYLNPGSVSIPKENTAHSYMTLEGSTACWKTMEGACYHQLQL